MTTPLNTTPAADLPTAFGRGRGSRKDSFWYTGWLLNGRERRPDTWDSADRGRS
jgi:hypothetical protein